jgi:hypothetical protein
MRLLDRHGVGNYSSAAARDSSHAARTVRRCAGAPVRRCVKYQRASRVLSTISRVDVGKTDTAIHVNHVALLPQEIHSVVGVR